MLDVAARLKAIAAEVASRKSRFGAGSEAERASILLLGGQFAGGTNFNVVPELAFFTVDRRTNPEEDLLVEKDRLLAVLEEARAQGVDLETEIFQEGHASATDESDPLACALAAAVTDVWGAPPRFELCPGLLETRFYAQRGIPALAYGPGRPHEAHGPDENVDVEALWKCAAVYALTAARLLGTQ